MGVEINLESEPRRLEIKFNILAVEQNTAHGKGGKSNRILLGDIDGKVQSFNPLTGDIDSALETKGASIKVLKSFPITKLSPADILVGDANGNIVLFSNGELLSRQSVSHSITAISIFSEFGGIARIFVGDQSGSVTVLSGLDLEIGYTFKVPEFNTPGTIPYENNVRCITSVEMNDDKTIGNYIAICSGTPMLHIYSGMQYIQTIRAPFPVTNICIGKFTADYNQLLIACSDGCLYTISNFSLVEFYASVGFRTFQLHAVNFPSDPRSYVLCSGHWNGIKLFYNRSILAEQTTSDWVHTLEVQAAEQNVVYFCAGQVDSTLLQMSIKLAQE